MSDVGRDECRVEWGKVGEGTMVKREMYFFSFIIYLSISYKIINYMFYKSIHTNKYTVVVICGKGTVYFYITLIKY